MRLAKKESFGEGIEHSVPNHSTFLVSNFFGLDLEKVFNTVVFRCVTDRQLESLLMNLCERPLVLMHLVVVLL